MLHILAWVTTPCFLLPIPTFKADARSSHSATSKLTLRSGGRNTVFTSLYSMTPTQGFWYLRNPLKDDHSGTLRLVSKRMLNTCIPQPQGLPSSGSWLQPYHLIVSLFLSFSFWPFYGLFFAPNTSCMAGFLSFGPKLKQFSGDTAGCGGPHWNLSTRES